MMQLTRTSWASRTNRTSHNQLGYGLMELQSEYPEEWTGNAPDGRSGNAGESQPNCKLTIKSEEWISSGWIHELEEWWWQKEGGGGKGNGNGINRKRKWKTAEEEVRPPGFPPPPHPWPRSWLTTCAEAANVSCRCQKAQERSAGLDASAISGRRRATAAEFPAAFKWIVNERHVRRWLWGDEWTATVAPASAVGTDGRRESGRKWLVENRKQKSKPQLLLSVPSTTTTTTTTGTTGTTESWFSHVRQGKMFPIDVE